MRQNEHYWIIAVLLLIMFSWYSSFKNPINPFGSIEAEHEYWSKIQHVHEGRYSIDNYHLDIINVNDVGFDFDIGGVSQTDDICSLKGNAKFSTQNMAIYMDNHPDLEDVYKGKSCIYVFNINNDSIKISANNNRCVMMHCGSSATMLHQYIKE